MHIDACIWGPQFGSSEAAFHSRGGCMDEITADQLLDCSGLLCPMPVVKTSKAIKTLEVGQILEMVATDPGAPPDMEAWARQTGNPLLKQTAGDGEYRFWFRRA